jgi:hypothetical protein
MLDTLLFALCAFAGWLVARFAASQADGDVGAAVMVVLSMFGAGIIAIILFLAVVFGSAGDHVTGLRVAIFLSVYTVSLYLIGRPHRAR